MKISECPNCHQKRGFLTFRYVRKWNIPYIGHYDSKKYEEQVKKFQNGKRKSKPDGRRWCHITWFQLIRLNFNDKWYENYLKLLKQIYEKYNKYGFRDLYYVIEMCERGYTLKKIRKEFIVNKHWSKTYQQTSLLLSTNGFPRKHIQKKILSDIYWKFIFDERKKDRILYSICLD